MANEEPVSNNEPSNKETKTSDPAMENVLASPQQTADGKGTTNPLSPIILEKDERASQAQDKSPKTNCLQPNSTGIQVQNKSEEKSPVLEQSSEGIQEPKTYYVVYNGPNPGIYTCWNEANAAVKGISNVKHRKFKTLMQPKASANIYTNAMHKGPLVLIRKSHSRPMLQLSTELRRRKAT